MMMPDTIQPRAEPPVPETSREPDLDELPLEPPMRLVTKGWWVWREELVPREILEAEDRQTAERRAARRSLKALIFGRG
jgi:hypothetical protein